VKMRKLASLALVPMIFSASAVLAKSDYPASDFQPKVVYNDSSYKHSSSESVSSSSASSQAEVSKADPNFPAANFKPEVLFHDAGYQHKADVVKTSKSSASSASSSAVSESDSQPVTGASEKSDSSLSAILGLVVLAVGGYLFLNKKGSGKVASAPRRASYTTSAAASSDSSVSGVSKYLQTKVGEKPSSVAKYLQEKDSAPVSGVSKYVARQKVSARLASVTGVEKYLKERG
jgi:hypothetical protein